MNANSHFSGELEGMNTIFDISAETPSLNFIYHDVEYLSKGQVKIENNPKITVITKFEFFKTKNLLVTTPVNGALIFT